MESLLARHDRRLNSTNVGSLAGLIALNRGDAHLAGSHLLDPKTGDYNTSFIKRYIPNQPVSIFGYVNRQQGLIVRPGNPLKIRELKDLANPDIHFINRQRGAGTRVLLDYHLSQLEIEPEEINGYEQEEYTHLTCAAAVASGRADAALGIQAAAIALELDFVPIYVERYDIIVADQFVSSDLLKPFFDLLSSAELRKLIAQQPGYDPSPIGVQV
jgi:putative molybdopterin biosynthesis protein